MAEEGAEETNSLEQLKRSMQYALIKNCDMNEEMRSDAVDLVISATEKYQANYELAARMVKDQVRTPSWDERRHRAPRIFCGSVCALALVPLSPAARWVSRGRQTRQRSARANAPRVWRRCRRLSTTHEYRSHLSRSLGTSVPSYLVSRISQMDKKYNSNWIVAIGQGFSFEVTHEVKHVLWMYFCDIGVLVCKAGARQAGT